MTDSLSRPTDATRAFKRFTLWTIGFTLLVIMWGAVVRATGSGAGCGNHWPTCNGEVLHRPKSGATLIELAHRATSGIDLLMVLGQAIWAWRIFPRRSRVVRAALWGLGLMLLEAALGAGLVLFEMVAGNKSVARGAWVAAHLLNTNLLLGCLGLVALRSGALGAFAPPAAASRAHRGLHRWLRVLSVGLLLVGMAGAITALGDTLFPAGTLTAGFAQDFSPTAHLFIRLRVWHPVMAVTVAVSLLMVVALWMSREPTRAQRTIGTALAGLLLIQLGIGAANLLLLAPVPLQLIHLLLADLIWLCAVWLGDQQNTQPAASLPDNRA